MATHQLNASRQDHATAYLLAIETFPKPSTHLEPLRKRRGTNPEAVFAVIDALRMDLQMRIGALHGNTSDRAPSAYGYAHASHRAPLEDRKTAYSLTLPKLPRVSPMWSRIIKNRADGSTASGVFAVIEALRIELYGKLGALYTVNDPNFLSAPPLRSRSRTP